MHPELVRARRRVLYIQYTNPATFPPLEHASRILADQGWDVLVLGIGAPGSANALRFPPHPRIRVMRLPYVAPGALQKAHYALYTLWSLLATLLWRPDWVYVSDILATIPGTLVSCVPGVRVLYHEHDAPGLATDTRFTRLCLSARRALARRAQLCVLPNPIRVSVFQDELEPRGPVLCVANFPRLEEVPPLSARRASGPLRLYYHGTIAEPLLPRSVIEAMARVAGDVRLRVVGYEPIGYEGYLRRLVELAQHLGVGDRLEVYPGTSRAQLWDLLREQDVGLALMPMSSANLNMQHLIGASNKLTDYLAAGLALLVPDLPAWNAAFVEPGYGLGCDRDDPASVASALRWFLAHRAETRAMAERGRQRVLDEWHYEREFAPVLAIMERLVQSGRGSSNRTRFAKQASLPPGP